MNWRSKGNLKYVAELKAQEPFTGHVITLAGCEVVKVRFVMRGEWAFYQERERATLLEAFAGRGVINRRSITRWDTGELISGAEAERIIVAVSEAMRRGGTQDVRVE